MQIIISGRGLKLTDAIEDYVNKKVNGLEKFFSGIIRAEVTVGLETHHHNKGEIFYAECKLEVPGHSVFAKKTDKTLYSAVDTMRDYLEGELKKHKAKLRGNERKKQLSGRDNKEYHGDE
ncbi:MAG: ribosome-associated translation inhibitor RaiA [Candidatus Magasanikbacteria bacterium]|nr:ribosome-associated translation inhibitor RaiA [Candidatus Magasanikbacteria bacterium]